MQLDELRLSLQQEHAPWDELRERRVLARAVRRREELAQRRVVLRRTFASVAIGAAAAALVIAIWTVRGGWFPHGSQVAGTLPAEPTAAPRIPPATMMLSDGSRAVLEGDAVVRVETATAEQMLLVQEEGKVRYEVAPNASRVFGVQAGNVLVTVLGTVFTVTMSDADVSVQVVVGRVQVRSPDRVAVLGVGDELVVARAAENAPGPDTPVAEQVLDADELAAQLQAASSASAAAAARRTDSSGSPSVESLLADADAARRRGEIGEAMRLLEQVVRGSPSDPRATSAQFTLARLYRSQGQSGRAAEAFHACWRRSPGGPLAEDARAEEALSWAAAGDRARAAQAARAYLAQHPAGAYAEKMTKLAGD